MLTQLWKSFAAEISEMWLAKDCNDLDDILFSRTMAFLIVTLACLCVVIAGVFLWILVTHPTILMCVFGCMVIPALVIKLLLNTAKKENESKERSLVGSKEDQLQ